VFSVRRRNCIPILLLACLLPAWGIVDAADEQQARSAAMTFGAALKQGDAGALRSILPDKGKVQLRLVRMGKEEGFFSSGQVRALIQSFLDQSTVSDFQIVRLEQDSRSYALVHARAEFTDASGRPASADLFLSFQPEGERWILREIRERPS